MRGQSRISRRKRKKSNTLEIAKELKRDGVSHEKIAKYTGLSIEEIEKL
jgi:hypothetical protein